MAALLDSGDRSRPQDGHAPGPPTESRRCDGRLLERHAEAGKTCRSGVWIGKAAEAQPRPDFFRATGSVDAEREFLGRRRFDPDADAVAPATGAGGLNEEGRKAVASHEEPGRRHRLGMGDAHEPGGPALCKTAGGESAGPYEKVLVGAVP